MSVFWPPVTISDLYFCVSAVLVSSERIGTTAVESSSFAFVNVFFGWNCNACAVTVNGCECSLTGGCLSFFS